MQNNTFFGLYSPQNVIVLEEIHSTNDYAKELLTNFKPQIDLTAIMAKHQTAGKGQRGAQWLTQPHANLAVSIIHTPNNLSIHKQFNLTIASSLATYDVIKMYLDQEAFIKWPNDIMIQNRKIAGILIENKLAGQNIKHAIFGIGINIEQTQFHNDIAHKTTSFKLENSELHLTKLEIVHNLQERLNFYLNQVEKNFDVTFNTYKSKLYKRNLKTSYSIEGKVCEAEIIDVNQDGQLIMQINGDLRSFNLKEVNYLL